MRLILVALLTAAAPPVSDPLLAPPPEAPARLESWAQALELIRAQSPSYAQRAQAVQRAQGAARIALGAVLPTLTATGAFTHQFSTEDVTLAGVTFTTPPPNLLSAQASANWSVLNLRALHDLGTAGRELDAAKLSFADARREIASSAVGAILATLATTRVAELNRTGLRTALERLSLTEARQQFGQGTALDHDRALQDVASARAQVLSGDESLLQAREALGLLLGSRTPLAAPAALDLQQFEQAVAQTCKLNADLERRPDVAAAALRLEVAERNVTSAELQPLPIVSLFAQGGHASEAVLAPLNTFAMGATLTFPLYDGGVRYGVLRINRAAAEEARAALNQTRLAAVVSSARASRAVTVLTASRDVAKDQRDLAARIDERTQGGYAQGFGTSLDLVTSAQALRAAENNLALLEFQVAQARANAVLTNAECAF